ncbi:MAG TPA: YraN family protein [Actinomycetota bacterium]|nr:YraN family protein [Actinomycetota bacterium]
MPDARLVLGARGEQAALDLYLRRGFTLVARNWRCSLGEIDLVLRRRDVTVFCEVKTRRGSRHGGGFEAVDARKRRKLRALAEVFVLTHATGHAAVRFDVASVAIGAGGRPDAIQVEVFEDAF